MTTTASLLNLDQIRAQIIIVRSEIQNVLSGSPYQVEITDKLKSTAPSLVLTLTSTRINDRDFRQIIHIKPTYKRWSADIIGVSVVVSKAAHRGARDRVYTNINKEMYAKIKEYLVPLEELIHNRIQSRSAADAEEFRWNTIRAEQLNGVIEAPGMDCNIIMGNGPDAGKYHVRFSNTGISLGSTPLTADQVKRLAAMVNEFMRTENYLVIVAAWPDHNKVFQWTTHAGWRDGLTEGVKLILPQDLEAELAKATEQAGNQWKLKTMKYADVFTIKP